MQIKATFALLFLLHLSCHTLLRAQPSIDSNKVLLSQFTKITTGTSNSSIGSYAAVGTDAKSIVLNGSIVKKGKVFGFKISGGGQDGILNIFNSDKLNSNLGGEVKLHKLLGSNYIERNTFKIDEITKEYQQAKEKYLSQQYLSLSKSTTKAIQTKIDTIEKHIDILEKKSTRLKSKATPDQATSQQIELKLRMTDQLITNQKKQLDELTQKLDEISKNEGDYLEEVKEKNEQEFDNTEIELQNKMDQLGVNGINIRWITLGYGFTNNTIKLFNEDHLPSRQLIDTSCISQQFTFAYSGYKNHSYKGNGWYWSLGLLLNYTTNLHDLSTITLENSKPVNGNPELSEVSTINAFQGDYTEGIWGASWYADTYLFFGRKEMPIALHFNPMTSINSAIKKPITDLYWGILLPFMDNNKQSARINIEVFYKNTDIFNYTKNASNAFGIRVALPINFLQ